MMHNPQEVDPVFIRDSPVIIRISWAFFRYNEVIVYGRQRARQMGYVSKTHLMNQYPMVN
jgi:hypothetical protein